MHWWRGNKLGRQAFGTRKVWHIYTDSFQKWIKYLKEFPAFNQNIRSLEVIILSKQVKSWTNQKSTTLLGSTPEVRVKWANCCPWDWRDKQANTGVQAYLSGAETHAQKRPQEAVPGEESLNCGWRMAACSVWTTLGDKNLIGRLLQFWWDLSPRMRPGFHNKDWRIPKCFWAETGGGVGLRAVWNMPEPSVLLNRAWAQRTQPTRI